MAKGFHITLKSQLSRIYNNGLVPKIGKRSNSVNEHTPILCFTIALKTIPEWKRRMFPNNSFEELAILTFDLDGIEHGNRYDNYGDCFTMHTIPKESLNIIEVLDKEGNKASLDKLQEALLNSSSGYQIVERLFEYQENIISDTERQEIIEKLADYEHKKWSEWQDSILWTGKEMPNGDLVITPEKIKDILAHLNIDYEQTDEIYKKEINQRVKESLYIITESCIFDEMEISEEKLLSILEEVEHSRSNKWASYMLSLCTEFDGKYIISKARVDWWKSEIKTPYTELSEKLKQYDREEVYSVFNAITEYTATSSKKTDGHKI